MSNNTDVDINSLSNSKKLGGRPKNAVWQHFECYPSKHPGHFGKSLAIKIFSITPHNAACERAFSALGFLYGKRRQCLGLSMIEDMAKIRYYLYSNIKNELNYESKERSEEELRSLVQGSGFFDDNDEDYDEGDSEDDSEGEEGLEIPNEDVYVLIVNEMVDLNNPIFNEDYDDLNDNIEVEDENMEESSEEVFDFDAIPEISPPSNM